MVRDMFLADLIIWNNYKAQHLEQMVITENKAMSPQYFGPQNARRIEPKWMASS